MRSLLAFFRRESSSFLVGARAVSSRLGLAALGAAVAFLLLQSPGRTGDGHEVGNGEGHASATVLSPVAEAWASELPDEASAASVLRPGYVMVLASWRCSFPRLEQVNEVALRLIEAPLSELTRQGRLVGWGQFNGEFRDEFNYHTYYIAESMEDYRRAIGRVLTHMNQEVPDEMHEFYDLCGTTRETRVTVITARP